MAVESDYILVPTQRLITPRFEVFAVANQLNSLKELSLAETFSGLADWVYTANDALTDAQRCTQERLTGLLKPLSHNVLPPTRTMRDLPAYAQAIRSADPIATRDQIMATWVQWAAKKAPERAADFSAEAAVEHSSVALQVMTCIYGEDELADAQAHKLREAHALLRDQPGLLLHQVAELIDSVWWTHGLADEWATHADMLAESAAAYAAMDWGSLDPIEAIRRITGRDLRDAFGDLLRNATRLTCVPSPHIGPYVGIAEDPEAAPDSGAMLLFFGARLPQGPSAASSQTASALSRSELLTRLNALADGHRLHILELLAEHGELCAQDLIERLGLSQSSVSRHLGQLSATGYISERRREVAKCYSLNRERIDDTISALHHFLRA